MHSYCQHETTMSGELKTPAAVPYVGIFFFLDVGLQARIQYSEGPATGLLATGFFLGFPVSISKC